MKQFFTEIKTITGLYLIIIFITPEAAGKIRNMRVNRPMQNAARKKHYQKVKVFITKPYILNCASKLSFAIVTHVIKVDRIECTT